LKFSGQMPMPRGTINPDRNGSGHEKAGIAVSSFDGSNASPSKSRRRLAAWIAFGVAGLATGAVWASGFASATGANDGLAESPAMTKTDPLADTDALDTRATKVADLAYDWQGRWGGISADITMFKVDLSGAQFNGKDYNVAVLLANTSTMTGWATHQVELEVIQQPAGTPDCTDPSVDYDGTTVGNLPKILNSDNEDSGVYWNTLDGDFVYCIGVASSSGDDFNGTFLRAAQDTAPTGWPVFIATVDRAA
jgi:hypothetical protein